MYDIRKVIFGKLISHEKKLPLIGYLHSNEETSETVESNLKILDTLELAFDKKVEIQEQKLNTEIGKAIETLKEVRVES